MQCSIVDVFAEKPLAGNQLAVVCQCGHLDAATMQAVAREMNFAETTFVVEESDGEARVRIFTPAQELPFAGHPTPVSCPASFWYFRVRHVRQCKAWSAGNIGHIRKGHNAVFMRGVSPRAPRLKAPACMANSRRARPGGARGGDPSHENCGLRPRCAPWKWSRPFPAGTRLATDPVGRAEVP